jgi:hypothetical protein
MPLARRTFPLLAATSLAALVLPAVVSAQAPDSARGSVRVRMAAGVDGRVYHGSQRTPAIFGLVGLEWLAPRAPFSARLDVSYFRRSNDHGDPVARGCVEFCRYADRLEVLGLSLDGRYTFFARSAVRPYLLSGFGLYRTVNTVTANYTCTDFSCTPTPDQKSTFSMSSIGLGLHSGIGLAVPIRRSELSLEARFHLQQLGSGFQNRYTIPIVLGIRF